MEKQRFFARTDRHVANTERLHERTRHLYAQQSKLSLIIDKDGDDKADEELVIASGWNEITQNVDATGLAMDKDGNLYFGLGTANFANAYLLDEQGKSHYDLERSWYGSEIVG